MLGFKAPNEALAGVDAAGVAALIAAAADIAFVIDDQGIVEDVAIPQPELAADLAPARFSGKPWPDSFAEDSRDKARAVLADSHAGAATRWRQLDHAAKASGAVVPVLYALAPLRGTSRTVAVGRDMRGLAALQQRLVETQITMERDYSRLRHSETRYRVAFQTSAEPVVIVEAATDKVAEANAAWTALFGDAVGRPLGRAIPARIEAAGAQALQAMLARVRASLDTEPVKLKLTDGSGEFTVSTTLFRQGASAYCLMRFTPSLLSVAQSVPSALQGKLLSFVRKATDGYVVIDQSGQVLSANLAFLQMAQVVAEERARGQSLERWFGRSAVDLNVLIANVRQHGAITMFATVIRGEFGAMTDVEVSAVRLDEPDERPSFGLAIRNIGRRLAAPVSAAAARSVDEIKELIGRVSLKDMVRESTEMIEKLCIEAALQLTNDNRASAAEMLGLSRQSLYVKLRRFGIDDGFNSDVEGGRQ